MVTIRWMSGSVAGQGRTVKSAIDSLLDALGPFGQFILVERINEHFDIHCEEPSEAQFTVLQTAIPSEYPQAGHLRFLVDPDSDGDHHFVERPCKRRRMNSTRPALSLPRWYLDLTKNCGAEVPKRWGLKLPNGLGRLVTCRRCEAITTEMGAWLNLWAVEGQPEDPPVVHASSFWLCGNCAVTTVDSGVRFLFHCGMCELPFFEHDDDVLRDPNTRPQDEDIVWCNSCSCNFSSNFTGM